MVRPRGTFLLAMSDGLPIGCVGLKGTGSEVAEIKRLWICQTMRGFGIAKRLMHAVETVARELSVKTLRLDTNSALPEALKLYRTSGWVEIDRFTKTRIRTIFSRSISDLRIFNESGRTENHSRARVFGPGPDRTPAAVGANAPRAAEGLASLTAISGEIPALPVTTLLRAWRLTPSTQSSVHHTKIVRRKALPPHIGSRMSRSFVHENRIRTCSR